VAYRRAILEVSGDPIPGVAGTGWRDRTEPVTELPPPVGPWRFYRGINLGGKAVEVDGRKWDGDDAADFVCTDRRLENTQVALRPPTDPARAGMIRTFRYAPRKTSLTLTNVPAGSYAIFAYVWEEANPETITVSVQGRAVVRDYSTGMAGDWERLGPFLVDVTDGKIDLTATGGAANLSGIEVWKRK